MIVEIRKVISAPLIKKEVIDVCEEKGMSFTEYAYELIVQDVTKRISNKKLSSDLAKEKICSKTFIGEIMRVVEKYEKSLLEK